VRNIKVKAEINRDYLMTCNNVWMRDAKAIDYQNPSENWQHYHWKDISGDTVATPQSLMLAFSMKCSIASSLLFFRLKSLTIIHKIYAWFADWTQVFKVEVGTTKFVEPLVLNESCYTLPTEIADWVSSNQTNLRLGLLISLGKNVLFRVFNKNRPIVHTPYISPYILDCVSGNRFNSTRPTSN